MWTALPQSPQNRLHPPLQSAEYSSFRPNPTDRSRCLLTAVSENSTMAEAGSSSAPELARSLLGSERQMGHSPGLPAVMELGFSHSGSAAESAASRSYRTRRGGRPTSWSDCWVQLRVRDGAISSTSGAVASPEASFPRNGPDQACRAVAATTEGEKDKNFGPTCAFGMQVQYSLSRCACLKAR